MSEEMLKKRNALKDLSDAAIAESIGTENEGYTVNHLLMTYFYNVKNNLQFKSFKAWQAEGFQVKKGSKAFLLWGEPINKNENKKKENTEEKEPEDLFFPLAFVFSSEQVEPLKK